MHRQGVDRQHPGRQLGTGAQRPMRSHFLRDPGFIQEVLGGSAMIAYNLR